MAHKIQDVDNHHAGDALDMTVSIEKTDGSVKDITNGSAEWLLKETATDSDANALLTKTKSGGGITFTDAANGKLEISLDTSDTGGLSGEKHHRLRVTDSDGDRVTVFTGTFAIQV